METQIKKLVELCEDFKKFSLQVNGWEIARYEDDKIRCYFASNPAHSSVSFENIDVSFFNPPQISAEIKLLTESNLKDVIKRYTEILKKLKLEYKQKSKTELKQEKDNKIKLLKEQLSELEK